MALNQDVEQKPHHIVTMDQNSDSDLQALFDSVLKPDSTKKPLQVPFRMRNLPNSFFNPPSTGSKSPSISHSRENSADSAFGSAAGGGGTANIGGLQVSHSRAHSSPASLQQTYNGSVLGAQTNAQHHHMKQRSYDVVSAAQLQEELGPLPPGWEQARTLEGQIYYLNHVTRTTTWDDPRKTLAAQAAAQHQSADTLLSAPSQTQAQSPVTKAPSGTNDALGPLPEGWEQAATAEGEIYFINHQARTTSWFDPRIPTHLQRSPGTCVPGHTAAMQQSWLGLGGAVTGQCQPGGAGTPANNAATGNAVTAVGGQSSVVHQASQQKLRLQQLQQERERLKQRQHEIRMQELMRQQTSTELQMDPFLSGVTDHSRQESADSGLGLGNPYSMPHTPEDFLANIDDNMDCASESGAAMDATDISALSDNIDSTEDLVPSLQESKTRTPCFENVNGDLFTLTRGWPERSFEVNKYDFGLMECVTGTNAIEQPQY